MTSALTRRGFLKTAAATGATLAIAGGCDPAEPGPGFDDVPFGQVTLVRESTPAAAVARGVELMGRFSFIRPGQTVLLKPNMTGPILPPDVTSPAVLEALIAACRAAGAGQVIVAERTYAPLETVGVFDLEMYDGRCMRQVVEDAGAIFRPLDDEPWIEVRPAGAVDFAEPLLIPAILDEVDHFINVPAHKTHELAVFTMTLKNLFGFVHPDTRMSQVHDHVDNESDPDRILRMFAQMNLAFHPIVNVMDAIVSRTTGGPMPTGDSHPTNLVLFGKDRVAMDAVGLALLKLVGTEPHIADRPVWAQVQLAEAVRLGLGVSGPSEITLVGHGVPELPEIAAILEET